MKKLSLLFTFLLFASCNAPVENLEKKAGYLKAGDTKYDLSLGDNSAVEIWDQYLDAHNNQDLEAIKA
ncbi:MAG: hypothetical protein EVA42_06800, partial [Flavobacteriales bacterium]